MLGNFLKRLQIIVDQTEQTKGLGLCPSTDGQHVKACSEPLAGVNFTGGGFPNSGLRVWLCSECQCLFYTREG